MIEDARLLELPDRLIVAGVSIKADDLLPQYIYCQVRDRQIHHEPIRVNLDIDDG